MCAVIFAERFSKFLQADNDHHVKDTYNYVTVQADVKMPGRHFAYLEDGARHAAFQGAIQMAVDRMHANDKDARVLNLGCGAGASSAYNYYYYYYYYYTLFLPKARCVCRQAACKGCQSIQYCV